MTGEFAVAVHALVYLNHKGTTVPSDVLAENMCTNPARVRKVMAMLKKADLLVTREGADGGYTFTLDPAATTLRQVAEAVDANFVSAAWRPGRDDLDCLIASGMAGILDGLYGELDALCLERLAHVTIADLDHRIFGGRSSGGPVQCMGAPAGGDRHV